ncbi:MAG: hypothetical protein QXL24_05325, partial [Candidatus Jordarchaeaceae archaeon]
MDKKIKLFIAITLLALISGIGVTATMLVSSNTGMPLMPTLIHSKNGFVITEYSEETPKALMVTVNQAFKEWLIGKGNLVKAIIYKDNP